MSATDHESTPRACVFCGSTDKLSREHIWPNWVRIALPSDEKLMHVHRYGSGEGEHERIFPKLPYRMRLRIVCKPCNNNWMGQIENNAKPWALPMIVGNGKSLHETGEHDLATWAVLKTLVTHYASPVSYDDWLVPASHYRELYEFHEAPKPPEHTRVWIGAYRGDRHPATAMMRGLRLTRTEPDSGAPEASGCLAAFSVEGLVLVVSDTTLPSRSTSPSARTSGPPSGKSGHTKSRSSGESRRS